MIDLLNARIKPHISAHSRIPYYELVGYFRVNIAIAYYDNGWISKGWNSLNVYPPSLCGSIVLLDQPLQEKEYYIYVTTSDALKKSVAPSQPPIPYYTLRQKNSQPANDCFWLEDENFYRNNAKYYGEGGLIRIGGNLFLGNKWTSGWDVVDVENAYDYTI